MRLAKSAARLVAAVALALAIAGCGNKGPLRLPTAKPTVPAGVTPPSGSTSAPSPAPAAPGAEGSPSGAPSAAPSDRDVGPGVPFPPR